MTKKRDTSFFIFVQLLHDLEITLNSGIEQINLFFNQLIDNLFSIFFFLKS